MDSERKTNKLEYDYYLMTKQVNQIVVLEAYTTAMSWAKTNGQPIRILHVYALTTGRTDDEM